MLNENVRKFAKVACFAVVFFLLVGMLILIIESPNIKITATKYDGSTENLSWWLLVFVPIVVASVIATLFSLRASKNEEKLLHKFYKSKLSYAEKKSAELEKLNHATNQELIRAQTSIVSQERWKECAIKCNPEIEHLVLESFAKGEADNFKKDYPELETLEASHNNYSIFVKSLNAYHKLSDEAKTIVGLNIETVRQKLKESLANYIDFARNYLKEADSKLEGTPENLKELLKVINWLENLPATVQNQIPSILVTSLMMKKANAEYQNAIMSGNVETEKEPEKIEFFKKISNWLADKFSILGNKIKIWFQEKKDNCSNYFTLPLEYEYQDEVLEEDEEEVHVESNIDDTDENPNYI